MVELAEATRIARSTDDVWVALSDFGGIGRWAPNVNHSCLTTEQSEGVGSVRRVQVGRNVLLERVVDWEPGERVSYAIDGLPPVVRSVINTWELADHGDSTMVTLRTSVDAGPRPPQKAVARVFSKVLAKASVQMLAGLKAHLEETTS